MGLVSDDIAAIMGEWTLGGVGPGWIVLRVVWSAYAYRATAARCSVESAIEFDIRADLSATLARKW